MAFTTCNSPIVGGSLGGFVYFYPQDISILMNQSGALAVAPAIATISGASRQVMVAVKSLATGELLVEVNNFMALPCPPYYDPNGFAPGQYVPLGQLS